MSVSGRALGQHALNSGIDPQAPREISENSVMDCTFPYLMKFIAIFKYQSSPP